ncbi:hypothetical protein [Spirosoma sp.]|uniref:hypothetical protein n=1 Tax=Spirosoma sp. TaxID=1899569 RepID=UPI002632DD9A|nr:hypothetical protein [Spirosoma sp.]MCX6217599.1 hypothetical protein [Spirosoma sp.]
MKLDFKKQPTPPSAPDAPATPPATEYRSARPAGDAEPQTLDKRHNHMLQMVTGLILCFLLFYSLADYTSYSAGRIHPGEMIFSNTMIQLWTATYRMAFIFAIVMAFISLCWTGLWKFFKPSPDRDFDLLTSIRYDLTPEKRIWLFVIVFFASCFLFAFLLTANLTESVSVSP